MYVPRGKTRLPEVYSVDDIASRIKNMLSYDLILKSLTVEGTLTDFKRHVSGHVYFTLKGASASLPGVMFRSDAYSVPAWPRVGDRVVLTGSVKLYEARTSVQFYARTIAPLGLSAAARAKEELRQKLEKEGLFAPSRKRRIPFCPSVVACVTSSTGAAVHDVIRTRNARFPAAKLIVVPTLVQGVRAPENAAMALRRASSIPGVDAVLLVRGGGGKEDLNPFDDEILVREVARMPVPVVVGVGHEIDLSLCDLAADVSVPTPTAAASAVFRDRNADIREISHRGIRLTRATLRRVQRNRDYLKQAGERITGSVRYSIGNSGQKLDILSDRAALTLKTRILSQKSALETLKNGLENLSPVRMASRGFALVRKGTSPVTSLDDITTGDPLTVQLPDGNIFVDVTGTSERA